MLDTSDMNFIREVVKEVKVDFVREVTSLKGDMAGRVSTLNTQILAEFKIVHDRLGDHKRVSDAELSRIRIDVEAEKIANARKLTELETKSCSDVRLHVTAEHANGKKDRNGAWTLLRDVAMIVTMIGVVYGLMKDTFVTPRDLLPKNPIVVNGTMPNK